MGSQAHQTTRRHLHREGEAIGDAIDNATEWGYRDDGTVFWYDEVTDTVVIKNPNGEGTAYRPKEDQ